MNEYTTASYRYAKAGNVVRPHNADGFRNRADRLISAMGGRWAHRAGGYVVSAAKLAKFEKMFAEGWDASFFGNLEAPAA